MNNKRLIEWQKELSQGQVTSRQIVEEYFKAIEAADDKIHAYLYVAKEEALKAADELDAERQNGKVRSAFHGLPIAIKDNISVQGMQNTCASKFLEGYVSPYDATVIERLKEAGAVILGKVNMDEFAMGSATEYSAFGPTRNPWDLDRVPGGSSGGSAAAVAAGFAPVSLGTDTGGSVRQPAAFTNLVGLKPTYGRISRYGVTAFGSTLDQVGILTRDVADCALTLEVLAGLDPKDSTSSDAPVTPFSQNLSGDLEGKRLALPKQVLEGLEEGMKKTFLETVEFYRSQGAVIEEVDLPLMSKALNVYYIVASAEASSNLARFDGVRFGLRVTPKEGQGDLYEASRTQGFGEEVKRRIMLGTYVLSAGFYDAYYQQALKVRTKIIEEFKAVLEKYDAIITPTTPTVPRKIGEKPASALEEYLNDLYTVPANITGLPAIAFPMGFIQGLPVSCQLIGNYFEESLLFNLAYGFEKAHDYSSKIAQGGR